MALDLTRLIASVERDKTVNQSAIDLLAGLSVQVRAAAGDKAASIALADALDANQQKLADAVVEHTVAENETPLVP